MRNSIHAEGMSPYKFEISKALLNDLKLTNVAESKVFRWGTWFTLLTFSTDQCWRCTFNAEKKVLMRVSFQILFTLSNIANCEYVFFAEGVYCNWKEIFNEEFFSDTINLFQYCPLWVSLQKALVVVGSFIVVRFSVTLKCRYGFCFSGWKNGFKCIV